MSGRETEGGASQNAVEAMRTIASAVRGDWSEFDGRWLRNIVDDWAERAPEGEGWDGWLRGRGICPECRSFDEHCFDFDAHYPEGRA